MINKTKILKRIIMFGFLGGAVSLLVGCFSSLGDMVNSSKSENYYYNSLKSKIIYTRGGYFISPNEEFDADIKTFKVLLENVAVDKNFVYYKSEIQNTIDAKTFVLDEDNTLKDKKYVYRVSWNKLKIVQNTDVATFRKLYIKNQDKTWHKDKNYYFLGYNPVDVDYDSFEFINYDFYKDKNYVYATNKMLKTDINPKQIRDINGIYIRDDTHLYFADEIPTKVYKISVKSFASLRFVNIYSAVVDDKLYVFGVLFKEKAVDVDTFVFLQDGYTKDKNHVYFKQTIKHEADAESFKNIGQGYSKDKNRVYHYSKVLIGADPNTFKKADKKGLKYKDDLGNTYKNGAKIK